MLTITIHAITFLFVISIVFPVWMIYRKTRARAELLIAIGWSILALVRLAILLEISDVSELASQLTIVNTAILAAGYWWLWYSSKDIFKNINKDKTELKNCKDELEKIKNGDNNASK